MRWLLCATFLVSGVAFCQEKEKKIRAYSMVRDPAKPGEVLCDYRAVVNAQGEVDVFLEPNYDRVDGGWKVIRERTQLLKTLKPGFAVRELEFDERAMYLAVAGDEEITLWSIQGVKLKEYKRFVVFAPPSDRIIMFHDGKFLIYARPKFNAAPLELNLPAVPKNPA